MGMDVFGTKPTSEAGKYFRNNMWWWRPLADFITRSYPEIASQCDYWQSNDGAGLDAEASLQLAELLDRDLANGRVTAYADQYKAELAALVDPECWLCHGTGLRVDEIGVRMGFDKPRDPETGTGGCNGCSGTGRSPHHAKSYPFEVENVREFAVFVRHSGGFSIC